MERRLEIVDGVVVNRALCQAGAVPPHMADWPVAPEGVGIGWTVDGEGYAPPVAAAPTAADVNAERDRRLMVGTALSVTGHATPITVNSLDRDNLNGLALAAVVQVGAGNGAATVVWRDNENVAHTITFEQVVELHGLAASYTQAVFAASWVIKDLDPIPADYADDARWP